MKECNCCMKSYQHTYKCFVNNSCNWRTCGGCVNKQLKFNGLDICYVCPVCRKDNIMGNHSRFTKYLKGSRTALVKINNMYREIVIKQYSIIDDVNRMTSPQFIMFQISSVLNQVAIDIAGNAVQEQTGDLV